MLINVCNTQGIFRLFNIYLCTETYPSLGKVLTVLDEHAFQELRIVYEQSGSSTFINTVKTNEDYTLADQGVFGKGAPNPGGGSAGIQFYSNSPKIAR